MNRYNVRLTLSMLAIIIAGYMVFTTPLLTLGFAFFGWWRFAHIISPRVAMWIGRKPNVRRTHAHVPCVRITYK